MGLTEIGMQLREALIHQAPSLELQRAAQAEIARMDVIESAARKVIAAFEALGSAGNAGSLLMARGRCEATMVALKAAVDAGHKSRA